MLDSQSEKIEETLWTSLRIFEERKNLLNKIEQRGSGQSQKVYEQRAKETQIHIERIRAMLLAPETTQDKVTDKK